ncbi:MAG: leucyl aminopeptidase [Myxococcota bacterium]|nr:leucyl aminopeptidase [Myxococcota bacterium]
MDIQVLSSHDEGTELVAIGRFQDADVSEAEEALNQRTEGRLSRRAERLKFKGKSGEKVSVEIQGATDDLRILLIGLGKESEWSPRSQRDFAATAVRSALSQREGSVAIYAPQSENGEAIVLGAILGDYRFDSLKSKGDEARAEISTLQVIGASTFDVARARTLGASVNLARELVNEPANICTPERLAAVAEGFASRPNVSVEIFGRDEIEARGWGGFTAVAQGATREPKFIHVKYVPAESRGRLAFVGKGLTFDSGGLSLKPPKSQEEMYIDMGGAAAVLGALDAITALQPDVEVHGLVGACENMPDGNSYRPSDVLTMGNQKTVEVLNTDAEGRLVLADVIHHATSLDPDGIVNLATLTGACMVGLGDNYCGLFSDDDRWAGSLQSAAESAGELVWRLPLDQRLAATLKSARADLRNIGGSWGGAITAALFLSNFKGEKTWAHLDIAGPTISSKIDGSVPKGGTGFGVLTLVSLAEGFKKS